MKSVALRVRARIPAPVAPGWTRLGAAGIVAIALGGCGRINDDQTALIDRYCLDCHNAEDAESGLVLEGLDPARPDAEPEIWEKVVHKLEIGLMPPPDVPHPDREQAASLVGFLETRLDAAAVPRPGRQPLHRLNRTEYGNAIRDLLGLSVDVESMLPADSSSHGFDNVSDALKTSPLLVERYLAVAQQVAAAAIGDTAVPPRTVRYDPAPDLSQNHWIDGLPLGTRGGLVVEHYFPVDAEYEFRPALWEAAASTVRGLEGFETPFEYQMLLDGEVVHSARLGGLEDDDLSNRDQGTATASAQERLRITLPVSAGMHRLGFTFVMKSFAMEQRMLQPFDSDVPLGNDAYGWPRIAQVQVVGPFDATSPGDTDVRRNIFICSPDARVGAVDCAERILTRLAQRAYSRPPGEDDISTLLEFYDQGSDGGRDFERGIELGLTRILSGPEFLFRGVDRSTAAAGDVYRVDDLTLASRLALFLWSSIPDDALLDDAIVGRLREPGVLEGQVRRMLADRRAESLVGNFAEQWLQLRNLDGKTPDLREFPDWDDNLRQDMVRETRLFVRDVLLGDASVLDLIGADYTYLNGRLAAHYGIDGVFGDAFRRVAITDPNRRGLLGQGSVLFQTSVATRTSPVFRGKWVMSNLFNAPPNPPPPNVPALDESAAGGAPQSVRERLERHRADPVCAACHLKMDPVGFALENFDAIGRWRDEDGGHPVDARGTLADGTVVDGPSGLRQAILDRPRIFVGTLTQKLMTYALARGIEPTDMPSVRAIVDAAAADDYRFSSIVLGIVQSDQFQLRVQPVDAAGITAGLTAGATTLAAAGSGSSIDR